LPPEFTIYGIEGTDFEMGEGLSPAVEKALDLLIERVTREVLEAGHA
jgi:Ni,Fe-hydrogenase maturation factor